MESQVLFENFERIFVLKKNYYFILNDLQIHVFGKLVLDQKRQAE